MRDIPNVVALTEVVPGDDFDKLRLHGEHLLPSDSGLLLADEDPVLGVEVGREPRRNSCKSPLGQ